MSQEWPWGSGTFSGSKAGKLPKQFGRDNPGGEISALQIA
jgi:hypothetical protein